MFRNRSSNNTHMHTRLLFISKAQRTKIPNCPTQLTSLLLPWTMETPTPPKHSYLYTNLQGIMSLHSYGNLCTNELNSKRKRETSIIILCKWYHNSNIDLIMTHYSQLLASLATSYVLWSVVIQSATDTNGFT